MFLTLLLVTFVVALFVSFIVARLFSASVRRILDRVVSPDLAGAWHRYLIFALYVVGISGGVRMYSLEQYINPRDPKAPPLILNADRWTLEVYRTVIETLQSTAWMLLVAFVFLLLAYVVARGLELRAGRQAERTAALTGRPEGI
jgi:branched-subunit amino acid ABC-type transport system permease component